MGNIGGPTPQDLLKGFEINKRNDNVLDVYFCARGPNVYYNYDFTARILTISTSNQEGGHHAFLFSQLDAEVLILMRNKLIELGGKPAPLSPEQSGQASETWGNLGQDAVALVGIYPAINKKLTTIFNFTTRQQLISSKDLTTSVETHLQPVSFDNVSERGLQQAAEAFERLGGKVDGDSVIRGTLPLKKAALTLS